MYEEGHYLAVLNAEGTFYICQCLQDIPFSGKKKLYNIRWLEEVSMDIYTKIDGTDKIPSQSILDEVMLTKITKTQYQLPKQEKDKIINILQITKKTSFKAKNHDYPEKTVSTEINHESSKKSDSEANKPESPKNTDSTENQYEFPNKTDTNPNKQESLEKTDPNENQQKSLKKTNSTINKHMSPNKTHSNANKHESQKKTFLTENTHESLEKTDPNENQQKSLKKTNSTINKHMSPNKTHSNANKHESQKKTISTENKQQSLEKNNLNENQHKSPIKNNSNKSKDNETFLEKDKICSYINNNDCIDENGCIKDNDFIDDIDLIYDLDNKRTKIRADSDDSLCSSDEFCSQKKGQVGRKQKKMKRVHTRTNKNYSSEDSDESVTKQITFYDMLRKEENNKRIYNKKHVCYYCHKSVNKMSRHLEIIHKTETEVSKILSLCKGSKERKDGFSQLTRIGDYYHNCEVLSLKDGNLILIRRPTEEEASRVSYNDYGPCPHCLGFLLKKHIWHHVSKNCPEIKLKNIKQDRSLVMAESQALMSSSLPTNLPNIFITTVLHALRNDDIAIACKQDNLILNFGLFSFEKFGDTQGELIRQSMRQLGRFLLQARQISSNIKSLSDCLSPHNFDDILQTVKHLCISKNIESNRPSLDIPSLALKLGHSLRKCASIERGKALRTGDLKKDRELQGFIHLMALEWSQKISSAALNSLQRKKLNIVQILPLTSDLLKLNKYLKETITSATEELACGSINDNVYFTLAKACLCKIIIFNKRRSGEASRITVEQYNTMPDWTTACTEELKKSLSSMEVTLINRLRLINVVGKRSRKVAIILTPDTKNAIDILIKLRHNILSIKSDNTYIFPLTNSKGHMRGDKILRKMCDASDLEKPELINSTRLRKYIATVTQIFDLNETECDWLARHLGHDIRVHRDFYRLQESAVELTKISRLLMVVDEGKVNEFSGKPLSEINLVDLPPLSDCSEKDDDDDDEEEKEDDDAVQTYYPTDNKILPCTSSGSIAKNNGAKNNGRTSKSVVKRQWKIEDRKIILESFRRNIKNNILPGKEDCLKFLAEHSPKLNDRTWKDIKYFIYNYLQKLKRVKK